MKNDSLEKIAEELLAAESVLLYPHVQMDGDTLGSSVALCRSLRSLGKDAWILIEDKIPDNLSFLDDDGFCTQQSAITAPDVCISVDCSDVERFEKRREIFFCGKRTICIDHHVTTEFFADLNYIDENASAVGEIIWKLIHVMGARADRLTAEAVYTAIITDTGNFQYSNTTRQTHLVAAELFELGIDHTGIAIRLYQNVRVERLRLQSRIMETMQLLSGGKAVIAHVTQEMLRETGALMEETEGIVEMLRNIAGVEIAAFLKEQGPQTIKAGFRAKSTWDVSAIALKHGGGGHKKASGCTIYEPLGRALEIMKNEIELLF